MALEKLLLARARGLLAGAFVFPLAYGVLGSGYQVRSDLVGALIGPMALTLPGAAIGLVLGTALPLTKLSLMFSLVITPVIFTGCMWYPWALLGAIRWFQVVTLFNPLTYASDGMRYAMLLSSHGQPARSIGWVLLVLCGSFALLGSASGSSSGGC